MKQKQKQINLANTVEIGLSLLGNYSGALLILFPAAREHIIQSFLEGTTIHIDQTLFILGLGVPDHGNKTKVPYIY